MPEPLRYRIKVLEKALAVLDLFGETGGTLTLAELTQRLGISKPTAFRIVNVLERQGYLEKPAGTAGYRLGFKLYRLGSLVNASASVQRLARPVLEALSAKCGETVHLVVLDRGEALYLDKIEGNRAVGVVSRVGMRLPAHCSGVGKVLLAHLTEDQVEAIVRERGLPRFTPSTITDREALRAELALVRERGYALDNEEIELGLRCVAAPVRDATGRVVAAVSISGPKFRFDDAETLKLAALARQASDRVTRALQDPTPTRLGARRPRNAKVDRTVKPRSAFGT